MLIRSILTVLDGSQRSELALKASISLGRLFHAHVEILYVQPYVNGAIQMLADSTVVGASAAIIDQMKNDVESRAARVEHLFKEYCADAGLKVEYGKTDSADRQPSFSLQLVTGQDCLEIARRGRLSDLIVMARAEPRDGGVHSTLLEAALFDTGRAVFIAGEFPDSFDARHVVVAWDGSREASLSVGQAMPFLKCAENVRIVTINHNDHVADPRSLAAYLERHEIVAIAERRLQGGNSVADALIDEIDIERGDLLIMGAYGHCALKEFPFGGVTQSVLEDSVVSVAMAH